MVFFCFVFFGVMVFVDSRVGSLWMSVDLGAGFGWEACTSSGGLQGANPRMPGDGRDNGGPCSGEEKNEAKLRMGWGSGSFIPFINGLDGWPTTFDLSGEGCSILCPALSSVAMSFVLCCLCCCELLCPFTGLSRKLQKQAYLFNRMILAVPNGKGVCCKKKRHLW